MVLLGEQQLVDAQHGVLIAARLDHDGADQRLRDSQPENRVVQLAERAERPELIAERLDRGAVGGQTPGWSADHQRRDALVAILGPAVEVFVRDAMALKALAHDGKHARELREHERLVALIEHLQQARLQHVEFGRGLPDAPLIEIWGSGTPQREFIYVDDLADASIFTMQRYDGSEPLNLGTGVSTSIAELADTIRSVVGYRGELRFDRSKPDGIPFKGLDSEPLKKMGWKPRYNLRQGLEEPYRWYLKLEARN